MGQVKGALLVNMLGYLHGRLGEAGLRTLLARQPAADRELLGGLLMAGGWYPVGAWNRTLDTYLLQVPDRVGEIQALARHVADKDLSTIYKALLKLGTVEFILDRSDSLWKRYFDRGQILTLDRTPRAWRLALEAPTAVDDGASETTCNVGVRTWMTHALALAGSKVKITHQRCRFVPGTDRCEYLVTW